MYTREESILWLPRIASGWFLAELLAYEPFRARLPSKQECLIILEAINNESKVRLSYHVTNQNVPNLHVFNKIGINYMSLGEVEFFKKQRVIILLLNPDPPCLPEPGHPSNKDH